MFLVRALNKHGNVQSCQNTVRGTGDASREEENRETVVKISIHSGRTARVPSRQGSQSEPKGVLTSTSLRITSTTLPTTMRKSNTFQGSPKYPCGDVKVEAELSNCRGGGRDLMDTHVGVQGALTLALKARSLRIISPVKSTVKMRLRVEDSLVMWSDWLQCCTDMKREHSSQSDILCRRVHFSMGIFKDYFYYLFR